MFMRMRTLGALVFPRAQHYPCAGPKDTRSVYVAENRKRINTLMFDWKQDSLHRMNRSPGYVDRAEAVIKSVCHWAGWERINDISAKGMIRWINHQSEEGAKVQTLKNQLSMFRTLTTFLVATDELPYDPILAVKVPGGRAERGDGASPLSADEMATLVAHAIDQEAKHWQARQHGRRSLLYLAMGTMGLRRGECRMMRWEDIDLQGGWMMIKNGKGKRVDRLPVPWELRLAMNREIMERRPPRNDRTFPSTDHNTFYADLKACNIERKPGVWHRFRKGYITHVGMMSSSDLLPALSRVTPSRATVASTMARHTTSKVTAEHYLRPDDEALWEIMQATTPALLPTSELKKLEKLLSSQKLGLQPWGSPVKMVATGESHVGNGTNGHENGARENGAVTRSRRAGSDNGRNRMTPPGFDLMGSARRLLRRDNRVNTRTPAIRRMRSLGVSDESLADFGRAASEMLGPRRAWLDRHATQEKPDDQPAACAAGPGELHAREP